MTTPKLSRCCPLCGGLLPLSSQLGLGRDVYCASPDHWRAATLDPESALADIERFNARRARTEEAVTRLRTATAELRRVLSATPLPPDALDNPDQEAAIRKLLGWLDDTQA
jgi:hypothetical protein